MSAEPDSFDMDAAWLRRSEGDLRAFMEAFAARLEGALPRRVAVERRRDGLLSKTSHVVQVKITGERALYQISFLKGVLSATRAKLVRGVVISTADVPVPQWLAEVRAEVQGLAEQAGSAGDVLHDFL